MDTKTLDRNPQGVTKAKAIALRLRPDERKKAEAAAATRGMTKSALARAAFLAGLDALSSATAKA